MAASASDGTATYLLNTATFTVAGPYSSSRVVIDGGLVDNQAEITFQPDITYNGSGYTPERVLMFSSAVTLTGAGTIRFTGAQTGFAGVSASSSLLNLDNTIRGDGLIYNLNLQNRGTVLAEGGELALTSTRVDNTGGTVHVAADGSLSLISSTLTGGTLQGDAGSRIANGTLEDLSVQGLLTVGSAFGYANPIIVGTIDNRGEIGFQPDNVYNGTGVWPEQQLAITTEATLSGGGTVRFAGAQTGFNGYNGSSASLSNLDNTLRGNGLIYYVNLKNRGTIRAEGGELSIYSGASIPAIDNVGGVFQIAADGTLSLVGATLGGGTVQADAGGRLSSGTLQDVSIQGLLTVGSSNSFANPVLAGTIDNHGEIGFQPDLVYNGTGYWPEQQLGITATATLTGGGTVRFAGAQTGFTGYNASASSLINVDNTLRGSGILYYVNLTNRGTLLAEGGELAITAKPSSPVVDNTGGLVHIAADGVLTLSNSTLSGGTLQTDAGGRIGSGALRDLALQGLLTIGSANGYANPSIGGTLENRGEISFQPDNVYNGSGYWPEQGLTIPDAVTLTGGGTIRFTGAQTGITGYNGGRASLTNVDNTLRGHGLLYYTKLQNQGAVVAEDGILTLTNVELTGSGTIAALTGAAIEQDSGSVRVSSVDIAPGGDYSLQSGRLEVAEFNGSFAQDSGVYVPTKAALPSTITGDYTMNGGSLEVHLAGTAQGGYTRLRVSGDMTINEQSPWSGTLQVVADNGFVVPAGSVYPIIQVDGVRSGAFAGTGQNSRIFGSFGSDLYISYTAGDGDDIALFSTLTPGSVDYSVAQPSNNAFFSGVHSASSTSTTTFTFANLDVLPASAFTLGPNETLDLGGTGTLFVAAGAVFSGNGVVLGNIRNAGLVRIPIVRVDQIARTTGGLLEIVPPSAPTPGVPVTINLPGASTINAGTLVRFSRTSAGGGCCGGGSGGGFGGGAGGSAVGGFKIVGNAPRNEGTLAFDASLEVTGRFEQAPTGTLRLFIAGREPGVSYSQLKVGQSVTLDGTLQIVLQPELFEQFNFQPLPGQAFDLVTAAGGITLAPGLHVRDLVTAAGSTNPLLAGLQLSAYSSGITADPDSLLLIGKDLFSISLANNGTVLRATYLASEVLPTPAPLPWWNAPLLGSLLALLAARKRGAIR